jgi:hypothetical protein
MDLPDLPSVPIENLDAFLAVVGQWNLYDMEIRELRFRAEPSTGAVLEADLCLHGDNLRPRAVGAQAIEHEFVFRFSDVQDCNLTSFGPQNVVGEYEFAAVPSADTDQAGVRVSISGVIGGDLLLKCRTIAIVSVREVPVRGAA